MNLIEILIAISVVINILTISVIIDYNKYIKRLENGLDSLMKERDRWYLSAMSVGKEQLELDLEEEKDVN